MVDSLPARLFDQLHGDWQVVLTPHKSKIEAIEAHIRTDVTTPDLTQIFRSLSRPISEAKVVIFGQDPYPGKGHAHGLAFSVDRAASPLPASLRNIFTELESDCGVKRTAGDLSDWFDQGVLLVNRVLSTRVGTSLAHDHIGWQEITRAVARELGTGDVVAILWGKNAGELGSHFRSEWRIESAHPSPLSAYRGFFGSKPFSRCNTILMQNGSSSIRW